jgi:hypothetical protein
MCISVLSPNIYIWLNFITRSNFMFLKSFMVVVLKDVLYTLLKNFFINVYVAFINVYFAQSFQSMFVNSKIPHTSFKIQTFQQVVVQN